jgi:beta-galactosidase
MIKINFNQQWKCYPTGQRENAVSVEVPHDAMQMDPKSENSPGGVNTGWYDARDYSYEKDFFVPEDYRGQQIVFEFEGVYRKASVYVNDQKVGFQDYGYIGFFVDVTEAVRFGEENAIRVEAVNSDQPNSRWYSGTGIYRPVWMYVLPQKHIELEGIRISTLDYKTPKIRVQAALCPGTSGAEETVRIEILDEGKVIADTTAPVGKGQTIPAQRETGEPGAAASCEIELAGATCWSPENPYLYTCRVTYGEDVQEERFGIRVVECTPEKGFCINGERVILRGACIHHDNGILGAREYDFANYRKVRILKEGGYNAIRSAHNPCSKSLLRACDEMGVMMMDEYVDVWYIHKTKYDYATEVEKNYREDLRAIVSKDYNHPSVIMYSTGNEVSESAQKRGIELCGKLTDRLHELDSSRPVSCGINIFFNFLSSMGFGVYSDKKADQAVEDAKKKKAVGSEFFNILAGICGAEFMKFGATLYPCDVKTRDSYANMDVAGYNYGIKRYAHDLKKYPNRIILGSETFCADAYKFYEAAKQNNRLIGDFVWAGIDYLGEVGIGSWEYKDYAPRFDNGLGWVSAGSGRIDLTGKPLSEMKYTRVAFELDKIGIGVVPVYQASKQHSSSAWKMTNAMESWSWHGCDGMETQVEVYARADSVKLYVNKKCVGKKKLTDDCKAVFKTKYHDGNVAAVSYDSDGKEIARCILRTAGEETVLSLEPEMEEIRRDGDLCYVRMRYTDKKGTLKPMARGKIKLDVTGGTILAIGSACPYYPDGYQGDEADTYYGEALAVIRPDEVDVIRIQATSPFGDAETEVRVTDKGEK